MGDDHLSLRASLSLSMSSRTSPMRTGPFTFLIKCRLSASFPEMRMTLTCVIPPLDPVLPSSWVTLAFTGSESMVANIILYQIIISDNPAPHARLLLCRLPRSLPPRVRRSRRPLQPAQGTQEDRAAAEAVPGEQPHARRAPRAAAAVHHLQQVARTHPSPVLQGAQTRGRAAERGNEEGEAGRDRQTQAAEHKAAHRAQAEGRQCPLPAAQPESGRLERAQEHPQDRVQTLRDHSRAEAEVQGPKVLQHQGGRLAGAAEGARLPPQEERGEPAGLPRPHQGRGASGEAEPQPHAGAEEGLEEAGEVSLAQAELPAVPGGRDRQLQDGHPCLQRLPSPRQVQGARRGGKERREGGLFVTVQGRGGSIRAN